jgi:FkbH-like protein
VLARHYGQLLDGVLSRTKKLLVVDLDNTLWGGVIGEEGIDGIQLGEDGVGKCYRDFQRAIAGLKRQGVLLAINSKNNLQDVQDAFERHPMMVLALDDFICKRINWSNKATNMAEIAAELNLGLDSFVFIDDNAVERQLVKENLPEVNVPDFPERPVQLRRWFVDSVVYSHFPRYRLTAEDQRKTEQYQANVGRQKLQESLDLQGFVEGLGITVRFYTDTLEHVDRATQLTQKTNQFNTTTRRYSPAQMRSFMESSSKGVVLLEYEDKFGKEGIVGLSLLDLDKGEVDSFLLSCRIIGRGVESRFLDEIERQMRETGHRAVTARFISTAKNQPASTLFEDHGYELCKKESNGTKLFKKELD